jgi:hypothetical protein
MRSPRRGCARGPPRRRREIAHTGGMAVFWRRAAGENAARYKVFPVRKHTQPLSLTISHLEAFFF